MLSMMKQQKKLILLQPYFFYVIYDGAKEKTHSVVTLFFLSCLWWSKRKKPFCSNIIFCMFSRMEEEKKTPSVRTLFYVSFLWMRRRKNWFGCQIIFYLLSMMKEEKKLILLEHYFLYDFYDAGAKKSHSVIKLFFWSSLWWTKRKNSFGYNIIFSLLSIMEQEKKLILLQLSFLYVVYDEGIEKTRSVVSLFFVSSLSWTEKKNSFCYNVIFCMFSMTEQQKKLILL